MRAFVIKAFNRRGDQLSYGSFSYSGTLEWSTWCDEPDTVAYVMRDWKSGLRHDASAPADTYVRNRVAYFEVCGTAGYLIVRANRSHPGWLDHVRESVRHHAEMIKAESELPRPIGNGLAILAQVESATPGWVGDTWSSPLMLIGADPGNPQSDAEARCSAPAPDATPDAAQSVSVADSGSTDGFEPSPYWGDETVSVVAMEAGRASTGLAVYRQPDGAFLEFVTTQWTREHGHETPQDALRRAGYDVSPVNAEPLDISEESWFEFTDMTRWPATSEKFSNGLAERAYDSDFPDDTMGDTDGFGHFSLVLDIDHQSAIVATNSQGFVTVSAYDTVDLARMAWDVLADEYEAFCMRGMEDALPTGSCDGIFLIFDTKRLIGRVPDREEVGSHIRECEACHPYGYVLEEF